jgi:hypothetical protein
MGTVYNGIDVAAAPFRAEKADWFLFLGRMDPTKGVRRAIEVVRAAGGRLLIAAKASEEAEQRYLEEEIESLLDEDAVYLGDVDATRKQQLLAEARALLFPIRWEEPFGLVMIEAMACGTPVVAMRRGSVPEVVDHGVTGFVCDSIEAMVEACDRLRTLDPGDIRPRCVERFDGSVMTRGIPGCLPFRHTRPRGVPAGGPARDPVPHRGLVRLSTPFASLGPRVSPGGMRKHIRRRVRIRRPGLQADADVNAVISVNTSGSRSSGSEEKRSEGDRGSEDRTDRPPSESEGGER